MCNKTNGQVQDIYSTKEKGEEVGENNLMLQ